jgi:hypothetical protein
MEGAEFKRPLHHYNLVYAVPWIQFWYSDRAKRFGMISVVAVSFTGENT